MNIIFNISKIKIQHPFFFWKAVKIQCFQILRNSYHEISLVVQCKIPCSLSSGPGFDSDGGARSHMPQLKIPYGATTNLSCRNKGQSSCILQLRLHTANK